MAHCLNALFVNRRRFFLRGLGTAAVLLAGETAADAAVIPGRVVLAEGDTPTGATSTVVSLTPPFAESSGAVGFGGTLADGDNYIFRDAGVIFLASSEVANTLSGVESSLGTAPGDQFVYSPAVNGDDAVWTDDGLLALDGAPALGFPAGTDWTFHSRPIMTASGDAYWVGGINNGAGGTATAARVALRSLTGLPGDIEVLIADGDVIGGLVIDSPSGIAFDFQVSQNDQHHIHVLTLDGLATTLDTAIYFDGAILAQEGDATGDGDAWDEFDLVATNNAGDTLWTGDTDAGTTADEVLVFNGSVVIREGDTVGGIVLQTSASLNFIALNDTGGVVHAWNSGGVERMFFACDSADIAGSSQAIVSTGDELDVDNDGVGDGVFVTNLNQSTISASRSLTDVGVAYLNVEIDDGVERTAVIAVDLLCCNNDGTVDPGEQCDDGNADNTDVCLDTCEDATCGDGFILAGVEDCDDGNLDDTDACVGACQVAACGDGFIQAGVEDCDDANAENTDACLDTCVAASCGDGFVRAKVEDCDDANADNTDACLDTCEDASCGDGFVQTGVEDCDDGNGRDGDGCDNDCTVSVGTTTGETEGGESSSTGEPTSAGTTMSTSGVDGSSTGDESSSTSTTGTASQGSETFGEVDTDVTAGEVEDDDGCACTAGSSGPRPGLWLVGLLGVLGVRRRRAR